MTHKRLRQVGILALLVLFVASSVAMPVMAQNSAVNYDADATQSQYYRGEVTIDTYRMDWNGLQWENDAGEVEDLAGQVNESADNPYSYTVTRVNASDFGAFPHQKDGVSALDAGEWTTSGASVSNVEPATGVDAVEMTLAQGDSATFSNFSIASDESKKSLMMAFDVDSLDSNAVIEVRINDSDGDYKMAEINASESSGEDWMAGATGDGFVFQRQLGEIPTETTSGSDGTFNDIEEVEVVGQTNGGTITVTALNLDKSGNYVLGDRLTDTDSDDELETETITEVKDGGPIAVTDLSTLGDTFDNAVVNGLTVDFHRYPSSLPSTAVKVNFSKAGAYPGFDFKIDLYYRMQLDTGYDLSYSNLELVAEQSVPESRYQATDIVEGASDTDFDDLSWNDAGVTYGSVGDTIVVEDTVQPSQNIALHYQYLVTGDERTAMQQTGGAIGPTGGSGGGIVGFITSIPGMIVTTLAGLAGGKWIMG
ncbi:hypothetical protein [Halobellus ruber]|uniref:Uncharacterized protein n=1 Tax=Halobellus ruber TaxID=2761102 RepID=A0A7J9SEC0_9EURY|nr:hypothetical protein [Halobellus ruber]MBB6645078.1 hypothetical protein [Halobellus ruber]